MGWVDAATSEKNDQLAKLIVKMRNDNDFYNSVEALADLMKNSTKVYNN